MPTRDELIRIIDELLERKPLGKQLPPEFVESYKANLVQLLNRRIGTALIEHMEDQDAERYLAMVVENDRANATELLQQAVPNAAELVQETVNSFLADVSYGRA